MTEQTRMGGTGPSADAWLAAAKEHTPWVALSAQEMIWRRVTEWDLRRSELDEMPWLVVERVLPMLHGHLGVMLRRRVESLIDDQEALRFSLEWASYMWLVSLVAFRLITPALAVMSEEGKARHFDIVRRRENGEIVDRRAEMRSLNDEWRALEQEAAAKTIWGFSEALHSYLDARTKCGSALEEAFLAGYVARENGLVHLIHASMRCQHEVGRYRVDFAFPEKKLAVELDGHAWHERTREQAVYDRARDRDLTDLGWRVLHFHYDEVKADLGKCCGEVSQAERKFQA